MTLYCEVDGITVYHGDCLEVTEWLAADVLVTDPPYGMKYDCGFRAKADRVKIAGDGSVDVRNKALQVWGGRAAVMFGTWRVPPPTGERQRLIWWKRGGGPGLGDLTMPWGTAHEEAYVLGDGWDRASAGASRAGSVYVSEGAQGGAGGINSRIGHPTTKPVGLMEWIIQRCPPGVIADPFAGSGSTLVAARNLGRQAVGVEVEEKYCEIIANRLSQAAFDF